MQTKRRAIADVMAERKDVQRAIKGLEEEIEPLSEKKRELDRELFAMLRDDDVSQYRSEHGLATIQKRKTAQVRDWPAFDEWARSNGFRIDSVMDKAPNAKALFEIQTEGVPMPSGLELGEIEQIRFTPSRD